MLDAARAAGVRRVLVVGSAEEYGLVDPADLPLTRRHAAPPGQPVRREQGRGVVPRAAGVARQRPRDDPRATVQPHRPGQSPSFFVPALAARIVEAERAGTDTIAVGILDPVRDLSDVRDVVRGVPLLMMRRRARRGLQRLPR